MLRRVAAFCRPLRPVLLLVSFPRSRSPAVGVPGLCWMWRDVPFARQRRPIVSVLRVVLVVAEVPDHQQSPAEQHDAGLCCCLQRAVPVGLSPLPPALSLHPLPPQAAVPIGLSPPLPLPGLPTPHTPPSFPSGDCANGGRYPPPPSPLHSPPPRRPACAQPLSP